MSAAALPRRRFLRMGLGMLSLPGLSRLRDATAAPAGPARTAVILV
jgi:hypothetical protein